MTVLEELRESVATACRIVGTLNMTKATTGHISARLDQDRILIRGRGPGETGVRFTGSEDVIVIDKDGRMVEGRGKLEPPSEVFIHTWIYRTRPEVNCVIHIHPPTVVLFTICNKPLLPIYGAYDPASVRLLLDGIPTYPRSVTISSDDLGKEFAEAIGDKQVCLMRGHGITAVGQTVEGATLTAIQLNELAEMNYRARLLGDPQPIPDEDIEHFRAMSARGGSPEGSRSRSRGSSEGAQDNPVWRYYRQLIGEDVE